MKKRAGVEELPGGRREGVVEEKRAGGECLEIARRMLDGVANKQDATVVVAIGKTKEQVAKGALARGDGRKVEESVVGGALAQEVGDEVEDEGRVDAVAPAGKETGEGSGEETMVHERG